MNTQADDSKLDVGVENHPANKEPWNGLYVLLALTAGVLGICGLGVFSAIEARLQGLQKQIDEQHLELQGLASRPDKLHEAYDRYFEAMKEVQRLQKGQPNGRGESLSDRLSDVERRLQGLDGQAALDAYGRRVFGGQQRGGSVAAIEDRVDRLAQALRGLIQELSQ